MDKGGWSGSAGEGAGDGPAAEGVGIETVGVASSCPAGELPGNRHPPFARDVMCGAGTEVRCRVEKCQKEGWGGHHCVHFVVSTPQW